MPIYWLNGNKVANQYEDFYDGSWGDEANRKTEAGTASSDTTIRTGSDPDGTEKGFGAFSLALGKSLATVGIPDSSATGSGPLSSGYQCCRLEHLAPLRPVGSVHGGRSPTAGRFPPTWSLIPSGLVVGDEFRLLFVSSTGRDASSESIDTYNTWIQSLAAAGHADIQDYSSTFTVVGSTAAVDARDNTQTTYTSSDKGVPIYWLNGNKVADDYEDFYDGSWGVQANRKDEAGTASSDVSIRTGSDHDGTEKGSGNSSTALGKSPSTVGFPNSSISGYGPLSSPTTSAEGTNLPLYGLSGVFRVGQGSTVNNATGKPAITGTPEVNQTLTADISGIMDEDGLPFLIQFSYQWIRSDGTTDSDISGATDSTYKVKAADQGKTIKVRVTFTDEGGTEETLTSDATTAVAADTTGPVVEEVTCFDSLCNLVFDELLDENPLA